MSAQPAEELFDWEYDGPVIEAKGLKKYFPLKTGLVAELLNRGQNKFVKAVADVDMQIWPGETMGLVGESGCGKTTLGEVIMGLQEPTAGTIRFLGQDMSEATKAQQKAFRRNVQIIFQNPYESLNPRFSVKEWLREPLRSTISTTRTSISCEPSDEPSCLRRRSTSTSTPTSCPAVSASVCRLRVH